MLLAINRPQDVQSLVDDLPASREKADGPCRLVTTLVDL